MCFQRSHGVMGIPFTVRQLTNCRSFRESWTKLVFSIFPRTNWRLAEMSTELEVEKQQNRSLLSTLTTRPVLEPPLHWKFQYFNMTLSPERNVGFSTSIPCPSNNSMVTDLIKFSSTNFFSLGFRISDRNDSYFQLLSCLFDLCALTKSHN